MLDKLACNDRGWSSSFLHHWCAAALLLLYALQMLLSAGPHSMQPCLQAWLERATAASDAFVAQVPTQRLLHLML